MQYLKSMKCRHITWYVVVFTVNLFCWYYALVFCSVYRNSTWGWIDGCLISLAMDVGMMQILIPLSRTVLRTLLRAYPYKFFLSLFNNYNEIVDYIGC